MELENSYNHLHILKVHEMYINKYTHHILIIYQLGNSCNLISFGYDAHYLVVVQSYNCIYEGVLGSSKFIHLAKIALFYPFQTAITSSLRLL